MQPTGCVRTRIDPEMTLFWAILAAVALGSFAYAFVHAPF